MTDQAALIAALRAGDEGAFAALFDAYGPTMLAVARTFVKTRAQAEDVVQETWLGVLRGLDGFQERSSLKTWIFRILTNVAKTRAEREGRVLPFSSFASAAYESDESSYDPARFKASTDPLEPGRWLTPPAPWDVPEKRLLSTEIGAVLREAIEALPQAQRVAITLRDVAGWSSEEVCNVLDVTETNQRVLLHRARSKVRRALERYLGQG